MGTDSLYYIMDYSGHYYRTNRADQLVAAAGEQEATVFTFAQANSHIGVGKKASFYCVVPVEENADDTNEEDSSGGYTEDTLDTKQRYSEEPTFEEKDGEETMAEERRYTPFDGKENDWLSFARQQAEFYRNAGQYITNLRMDMKEIDDEIESVLVETEEVNCNVAQGYKVFKRLKELRLEKKAKNQELKCLYALTDYIDCQSLADVCEDNLAEIEKIIGTPEHSEVTQMQPAADEQEENMYAAENIEDMVG